MHFFVKYFLMFLFFSSAGWLIESLYCSIGPMVSGKVKKFKFINRGFLTGPMTPIYGVSCMVMAATLLPFKHNIVAIFVLGLVVCDIVEYVTSFVMEKLFNARWWDYTGYFLNIKGRVCFRNSIIWGALSVVFIKGIYPGVNWIFDQVLDAITWEGIIAITFLLLGVFLVDLGRTVVASLSIHDLILKAKGFRNAVYSAGDKLKTSGDDLLTELQENYVEDLRSSIAHMAGWQRYRVKRMVEMYPQIRGIFSRTREEIMEVADISSLLGKLQFLRMDLETFFSQEKNEMY